MEIITFIPFDIKNSTQYDVLYKMFADYFEETFVNNPKDKVPIKFIPKVLQMIADGTEKYKVWFYLCKKNDDVIGFSLFQIDTPDNPMCKRNGWGFIREFYIISSQRRKGYASQMCKFVEEKLWETCTYNIYLTSDPNNGIPFWEAMGYTYTGETDISNGNKIYEKRCEK